MRFRALRAAGVHRLHVGSTHRAQPTTASSSTIVTSGSLSTRRHHLSQHQRMAQESRSKAGLGERRGSGDARSRCTWRASTRTEAGELTRHRSSPHRVRRQRLWISPPSEVPSFTMLLPTLKPTAAPEQPLISPDEGETQGDLWDPPNFIRVVTGVELQGGQCACTAAQPHTHGLHSPKAIS